jgi:hypothetical protein
LGCSRHFGLIKSDKVFVTPDQEIARAAERLEESLRDIRQRNDHAVLTAETSDISFADSKATYDSSSGQVVSCSTAAKLQEVCDRLGPAAVRSFFARWSRRLPSIFTETERRTGYGYEMAFRQFEVSDTWVFDRPQAGRMWFEGVIRDHLDVGRPDQIALIFHRRVNCRTPGRFRTRVIRKPQAFSPVTNDRSYRPID